MDRSLRSSVFLLFALTIGWTAVATADRAPGEIYRSFCATCHEGGVPKAPHAVEFQMLGSRAILSALENGVMAVQGATMNAAERRAVAELLGGSTLPAAGVDELKHCDAAHSRFVYGAPPPLDGWGMNLRSTRYIEKAVAGLDERSIPRLKLKWAFEFPGATRARSQPTVGGGALYVGSQNGTLYALDFESGCVRWTFQAKSEIRVSPTLEMWRRGNNKAKPRLWFADLAGNAYALDAITGQQIWTTRVDSHPRLTITGAPRYFEGRLYVPMSSSEWAAAATPTYECCTFRGGVTALNAADGSLVWRSYAVPEEPVATGETNPAGARRFAPAGVPVWNSPTIDVKRRRLYVGTGESYTSPASPYSDSVLAFDLDTGKRVWSYQSLTHDAWNMACLTSHTENCPRENGPDLDIGAPPVLQRLKNGREVLLVGEKSADVFSLDPEDGKLLWHVKYARGGYVGGVHWGMASAPSVLYTPIADTTITGAEKGERKPGLFALDPTSGAIKWFAPAPDACRADQKPACDPGYSAPATAIPGAVFSPSFDGWLRAYRESDGKLLWSFDTTQTFETVSGTKAHGGAIESAGAIVVGGRVAVNSGYLFGARMPGNVLLVFSVDGK